MPRFCCCFRCQRCQFSAQECVRFVPSSWPLEALIPAVNALRTIFLPSFQASFDTIEQKINRQTDHLKLQLQTAGFQSSRDRHRVVYELLQSSSSPKSPRDVDVKFPFRFTQYCIRNDNFFGRDAEHSQLRRDLEISSINQISSKLSSVAVYGLGGFVKPLSTCTAIMMLIPRFYGFTRTKRIS